MPFTFSHPAIVLPLAYWPRTVSVTGLIIGSMTPDFEYFLRMRVHSESSHTVAGLLWFDLPLGLVLAFAFHNVVRDELIAHLPPILRSRFDSLGRYSWNAHFRKQWWTVAISILIGAASHLLWDSFTHAGGYFVELHPILTADITLAGFDIPLYKILQHGSTVVGGLVIAFTIYRLPARDVSKSKSNRMYWPLVIVLAALIVVVRLAAGLPLAQYGHVIATVLSAALISLLIASAFNRYKRME